jgi:branched-chain amino acid transport system permease protein
MGRPKFGDALIEAGLAALVALLLAIPLIGIRLTEGLQGLGIETRFHWVAWGVGVVFFGRLALAMARGSRGDLLARLPSVPKAPVGTGKAIAGLLLALAFIMPFLPFADRYMVEIAITVLIYVMLGWGLNIVVGLAGLLDLGYVAFYAVGAYTYALLAINFDMSFWVCLPIAGLLAAMFGVLLGFPVLRLRGDYLAIVTLGFGEMIRIVLLNWKDFSGGPNGITSIPRPDFFGFPFAREGEPGQTTFHELFGLEFSSMHRIIFLYYLILALALLTNAFTLRMRKLPIGRAWEALREDEIACRALGINPTNVKLSAFALGAMFGGFAGAFFATRQGFISPESFSFIESAVILAIVVLGGMGSQMGVVIAAAFLILVPELLRDFSQYRMVMFGAAMVLIMLWRPQGLVAHRAPSARLEAGT